MGSKSIMYKSLDSAPSGVRTWKNVTCLRDHFAQYDFKKPPPFRKSAMKLCFIQCYPYLSHVRWRNFSVTSSLALDNWAHINVKRLAISDYWQWIVCTIKRAMAGFTQCTLFFQYVCFLLPICFPCISCGINAMSWHNVRQTFASLRSLGLFTFARIACLLLSLNKIKQSRLPWLGDAQIISVRKWKCQFFDSDSISSALRCHFFFCFTTMFLETHLFQLFYHEPYNALLFLSFNFG